MATDAALAAAVAARVIVAALVTGNNIVDMSDAARPAGSMSFVSMAMRSSKSTPRTYNSPHVARSTTEPRLHVDVGATIVATMASVIRLFPLPRLASAT